VCSAVPTFKAVYHQASHQQGRLPHSLQAQIYIYFQENLLTRGPIWVRKWNDY